MDHIVLSDLVETANGNVQSDRSRHKLAFALSLQTLQLVQVLCQLPVDRGRIPPRAIDRAKELLGGRAKSTSYP